MATLKNAVERLIRTGSIREAHVEAVFPGEHDPELASLFVVKFLGRPSEVMDCLRHLEGVVDAQPTAERRPLR
jgi:hypothetical protein